MQTIDIGILLSTEGTYSHLANSTLLGARHALEEINADPAYPFSCGPDISTLRVNSQPTVKR